MCKILLLSDTHSQIDDSIMKYVMQADQVWHAGDIGDIKVANMIQKYKPLYAVHGNIDDQQVRQEFGGELFFECQGVKVFIIHIGGYPGKYNQRVKEVLSVQKPDIYICGHSHILKVQYDKQYDVLHLNPGAAGISGFHQVRTMLRFTIEDKKIKDLDIIEWPKNKKTEQ